MKLAFICSKYPAISHTFVLREVEALRRLGASITTFTIRPTPPEQLLAEADRLAADTTVPILPVGWRRLLTAHLKLATRAPRAYFSTLGYALGLAPPGLRGLIWQFFYFAEAVLLWTECDIREIRHIHAHLANAAADLALIASYLGSALEPSRRWTWSFTMHGPTEFYDLRHFRLAEKVGSAQFVICISDFARSQLMGLSKPDVWDRLHAVHVGIPAQQFTPRREHCYEDGLRTILYVGRLVPEKGQGVLLKAVARLADRGFDVTVKLVGDGWLRSELEQLAEDFGIGERAVFLGAVGQDDIATLYEDATVFCLPSFAEGIPVVLMEAMAMEVPVVTTRITGIPELVEDDRSGLLVTPGNVDELTDALERLLQDPALRQRLGSEGRQKVLNEFNVDRSAARIYSLFEERCLPR